MSRRLIDPFEALSHQFAGLTPRTFDAPPLRPYQVGTEEPARKRRKKTLPLSRADAENREFHAHLVSWLAPAIDLAKQAHTQASRFNGWHGDSVEIIVSQAKDREHELPLLGQEGVRVDDKIIEVGKNVDTAKLSIQELSKNAYHNSSDRLCRVELTHESNLETYLIPPRSAFLVARMDEWQVPLEALARRSRGIDLVILDPPWPNASVSRSDSYATFDIYDLFRFDLPSVLKEASEDKRTLVAVWITNKPKFRRFVLDKLFPGWGVVPLATSWFWVKITGGTLKEGGNPVWPLSNEHRRCYEGLLLGIYSNVSQGITHQSPPPDRNVFLSVPLGHSRKPPILELLRPYLDSQKDPTVIELFARTALSAGESGTWISAGDEAIKFNAERYWTVPP